jgi:molecular chaperone GrpE (heat shock protein)
MSLRLGYCPNCREPISQDILPNDKKQSLLQAEREYEEMRERQLAEKEVNKSKKSHSSDSLTDPLGVINSLKDLN